MIQPGFSANAIISNHGGSRMQIQYNLPLWHSIGPSKMYTGLPPTKGSSSLECMKGAWTTVNRYTKWGVLMTAFTHSLSFSFWFERCWCCDFSYSSVAEGDGMPVAEVSPGACSRMPSWAMEVHCKLCHGSKFLTFHVFNNKKLLPPQKKSWTIVLKHSIPTISAHLSIKMCLILPSSKYDI